jgi:TetR/AcrR family transcriptional regulator, cholesterol catabolism regulator
VSTPTTRGSARGKDEAPAGSRRGRAGGPSLASQRRDHLVQLAAELFAKKGYQATTVREIADEAGILSGSLYHHFDSKESIVDEVLSSFLDDLLSTYRGIVKQGGGPRHVLAGLVRAGFASLGPHRAAITVMQNDWNYLQQFERFGYLTRAEHEVERIWVEQIEAGQREGVFRDDIDAKLTYRMIRDTIWLAVRWFRPGGRLNADGLAEHYIKVLFDGVCVEHDIPAQKGNRPGGA